MTDAERNEAARSPEGRVPRFVVPIAASGVVVNCVYSSKAIERTSEFLLLETVHCNVQVQEDIDPIRNKDPVMYCAQALLELLELAEETRASEQSQSSWHPRMRGASRANHREDADVVVELGVEGLYEDLHVEDYS